MSDVVDLAVVLGADERPPLVYRCFGDVWSLQFPVGLCLPVLVARSLYGWTWLAVLALQDDVSSLGFLGAARLSACARSVGLLRPSPSCVARIAQWEEMKKLPLVLNH